MVPLSSPEPKFRPVPAVPTPLGGEPGTGNRPAGMEQSKGAGNRSRPLRSCGRGCASPWPRSPPSCGGCAGGADGGRCGGGSSPRSGPCEARLDRDVPGSGAPAAPALPRPGHLDRRRRVPRRPADLGGGACCGRGARAGPRRPLPALPRRRLLARRGQAARPGPPAACPRAGAARRRPGRARAPRVVAELDPERARLARPGVERGRPRRLRLPAPHRRLPRPAGEHRRRVGLHRRRAPALHHDGGATRLRPSAHDGAVRISAGEAAAGAGARCAAWGSTPKPSPLSASHFGHAAAAGPR